MVVPAKMIRGTCPLRRFFKPAPSAWAGVLRTTLLIVTLIPLIAPARLLAASPPTAAPVPPLTAAQARQALDVLNDPQKRAQVANTLEAIMKAEGLNPPAANAAPANEPAAVSASPPAATPAAPAAAAAPATATPSAAAPEPSKVALNPDSFGAALLLSASGFLTQFSDRALTMSQTVQSFPLLWGWIVVMATNPIAQTLLTQAAWRVAIAFACGLLLEAIVRRLLRGPVGILEARSPDGNGTHAPAPPENSAEARAEAGDLEAPRPRRVAALTLLRRLPLVLVRFFLELLPVVAFTIGGHVIAGTALGGSQQTRLIIIAMVDAYALCGAFICLTRMMLSPDSRQLRLVRVSDATAAWATRWIRRIVVVTVFGYAIAEVGLLLGMAAPAHDGLLKVATLIDFVFLGIMVVQKRRAVRRRISPPPAAIGVAARLRRVVGASWHWVALFFLAATWFVWAVEIRHGVAKVLHFFLVTVAVVIGARLVSIVVLGFLDRMMRVTPEMAERYPGMETRLHSYHRFLHGAARGLVYAAAVIVLLQVWGLGLFEWFAENLLGRRLAAGFGTLVLTLVLALVVWEATNVAIDAHLVRLARDQQVARSARLRTLLPLLRSSLLVAVIVIAGLTVLSEIGINIAPLLAGAGIVGVAIGFGSQKLVQDLITGIFLLLENAMQVGDWVTVSGLSGSVENLSVRTIRLRASDGSVHIIPFSSVTSVTNTNRGLGNAAVSVTISYNEDTDRVAAVLNEIAAEMRKEPEHATRMLGELQLWGVDKVDGASVTLAGQIPCIVSGRWPVQREFNRRMKMRFQELGIVFWNPAQTYVVPVGPGATRPAITAPREAAAE